MNLKQTHTYVTIDVSGAAYEEIADILRKAGYDHVFDGDVIDMHGLALAMREPDKTVHAKYRRKK